MRFSIYEKNITDLLVTHDNIIARTKASCMQLQMSDVVFHGMVS